MPLQLKAKLTGDWEKARTILNNIPQVREAVNYAVMAEAQQARRAIVKGITDQAPGGQPFTPLARLTLALRKLRGFRGTKILIETASLRNSVTVKRAGPGRAFVGVLRSAQRPDGKQLFNIARVHEVGATIVMRKTPKMHRYLMAVLRKSGFGIKQRGRDHKTGKYSKARWRPSIRAGMGHGIVVIRIPPRPFIGPVIQEILNDPSGLQRRITMRIAYRMKLTLGRP